MNPAASTRSTVLNTVHAAAEQFHQRGEGTPVEGLEEVTPEVASLLARELRRAHDWATSPAGLAEEEDEIEGEDDYVSHDPVISLVQAAMDEHLDQPEGKSLGRLLAEILGLRTRNQVDFVPPGSNGDFVHALPERCRVVLVGDWGTAKPRAREVARAIAAARPDHIIHLGDIYPSGTRTRATKRFLDIWKEEVGDGPKFWAMNGNHEMHAGGVGYFQVVLPAWGQPASFFCLRNEHWKLIALDTSYRDHDLEPSQVPWLLHQLSNGPGNNILLTHHQMFSVVDTRPFKNGHKLPTTLQPVVETGRIFAWFWGHEHRCLLYAREIEWGNYFARTIGHGGKRIRMVNDGDLHPEIGPRLVHRWNVPHQDKPGRAMNGFALLTFDGPTLKVDYVDQRGRTQITETWPDQPLA
ncbi:MAG: metallophosphoesterase family protein [Longimicrobiaceae bacterium]